MFQTSFGLGKSNNAAQANSLAEAKCQTDFLVVRIKDGLVTKSLFSTASTLAIITDRGGELYRTVLFQ